MVAVRNRLLTAAHNMGDSTIFSATYALDAAGNRTQNTTPTGNETYTYDNLDRLTNVTYPDTTNTGYSFDQTGNRLTMTTAAGTANYSYDAADRLTSLTPPASGAQTNTYDANGSETGRNADSFTWNAANRLSTAIVVGSDPESFTYNGDGLRQARTDTATHVTTSFVWDLQPMLPAWQAEKPSKRALNPLDVNTAVPAGLPVVLDDGTQYIYGIGLVEQISAGAPYYFLADGLGSVVAIVDGSGTVQQTESYDAFGKATAGTNNHPSGYGFTGQQTDPSNLLYLRARFYDPASGRFLDRDPQSGSVFDPATSHPYGYARNNPVRYADKRGLECGEAEPNPDRESFAPATITCTGISSLPAGFEGNVICDDWCAIQFENGFVGCGDQGCVFFTNLVNGARQFANTGNTPVGWCYFGQPSCGGQTYSKGSKIFQCIMAEIQFIGGAGADIVVSGAVEAVVTYFVPEAGEIVALVNGRNDTLAALRDFGDVVQACT